jgi:hypothetical protein
LVEEGYYGSKKNKDYKKGEEDNDIKSTRRNAFT